jgi:hypothetical protein
LGKHANEISKTISTIRANEIAKDTLLEAKQKILQAKQKEKASTHTEIERAESERVREEPDESSDRNVKAKGKGKASDVSTVEGDEIEETARLQQAMKHPRERDLYLIDKKKPKRTTSGTE